MNFRASLQKIAAPFLLLGDGGTFLDVLGTAIDAHARAALEGSRAWLPGLAPDDALPYIGRDRRIVRGFAESPNSYVGRLVRWLDDWKKAGNAYAMMRQLRGYLSPFAVRIRVVNNGGTWYTLNADGTTEYRRTKPAPNWNWDGATSAWSRFWVILYPPAELWEPSSPLGSGGVLGEGRTIGTTATREQVATVRALVRQWKPAGSRCPYIIIAFDPASFDPEGPPGPPLPDGDWKRHGKGGSGPRVRGRLATARYWKGTS